MNWCVCRNDRGADFEVDRLPIGGDSGINLDIHQHSLVEGFKLRVEALDQLIKWRLLRVPGTIDAASLLGPAWHT